MIRYKLSSENHVVLLSSRRGDKIAEFLPRDVNNFVDILEEDEYWYKVRVYSPDGNVVVGWILKFDNPIQLTNRHELFNGRFNSR